MIYYINIFIELVLAIIILYGSANGSKMLATESMSIERRKCYCIVCGGLWILISGLRGLSVGADTTAYYYSYLGVKNSSFQELFENVIGRILSNSGKRDPGYDVFVKLTQFISGNYQVYLIIIALIFMIPFIIWVIRESKNPLVSFVLYSSLFYAFFAITGLRQTISTALVVLIGDKFIKERKIIPFLILVFLASLIHMSALVFLPFYFLSRVKVKQSTIAIAGVAFLLSAIFRSQLKAIFIMISGYDEYMSDYINAGTTNFTLLLLLLFFMSIFSYKRDVDIEENKRFYIALYVSMFFVPLTFLNPSAMRIVQYFSIYLVLLIPEMIDAVFSYKSKYIATVIVVGVLVMLLLRSNPTYLFFWQ